VGQHVEIHVPALGEEISFDGLIIFVADTLNPLTRTVMVRTMVENSSRKLKPDMLATMHIVDNPTKSLVVPISAVVRDANRIMYSCLKVIISSYASLSSLGLKLPICARS
jgi:cobalt-zinc-cadmium efflux system membrane fusion protein